LVHTLGVTWSPFVLVAGLLLIGHVAADEGLFRLVGSWCARVPGGGVTSFVVTMVAVALVTAVLNLDTSVVFMTPVALHAARAKETDETAFCYGAIFMSNAASLLLLGSNLTNLLVFADRGVSGSDFAAHMAEPWVVSVIVTTLVVLAWRWRALRRAAAAADVERERPDVGPGTAAVAFAVIAMLAIPQPALWVFGAGALVQLYQVARGSLAWRAALAATNPGVLALLFLVAVAVGWFARVTSVASSLLTHSGLVVTVATAGLTSLVINNLPAASLFAAHDVAHPFALLLGLDLGPNCAVTGALSSLLWLRLTRREGARTSVATFSAVGAIAAVLAAGAAMAVLG
jgi:arsenical pump membrane protein